MGQGNGKFLKKLLATFKLEAEEHVRAMSTGLLELEKASVAGEQKELIETVFREAHSLKGAARAVNLREIETICQAWEDVFAALKGQDISLSPALFDLLHQVVDALGKLLASAPAADTASHQPVTAMIQALESAARGIPTPPQPETRTKTEESAPPAPEPQPRLMAAEQKPLLTETVRTSTAKLDSLFLQAEELVSAKLAARQRAAELREIITAPVLWERQRTKIRPDVRALQQLFDPHGRGSDGEHGGERLEKTRQPAARLLAFLEWNDSYVKSLNTRLETLARSAEQDHRTLARMTDDLREDMKQVLMLPLASLLELFPKLVRDLARDRGKGVDLVIQGGEVETERRILEEMKDPLVHLIRNCIDHGIEALPERERKKKPPRGTITIAVSSKTGDKVEIVVSDDGGGIDAARVRAAALKLGIVSPQDAEHMSDQAILSLAFQSGVSTSPIITDISGRGLGLAIVREKVEKLGGTISMETHPAQGTSFRMVLPLTLATFRGILVRVGEQLFVLPAMNVERVLRARGNEIRTVENRETIQVEGRVVSLVRLGDVLELPRKREPDNSEDTKPVVVLTSAEKRVAFLVDAILDEMEVLVKGLGRQLSRVRNVAGATVLGTGQVVLVLNVPDLVKSAAKVSPSPVAAAAAVREDGAKRQSILTVEDSITARTLLKNILESAGYSVTTAVDGVDAWTALKTAHFDLVVSDVDMPRMNGFDLTAKIRADKKLSELPVVLVTALESREDRERGIDVGANAYIVKKSFDQSDLLGVIRRLI